MFWSQLPKDLLGNSFQIEDLESLHNYQLYGVDNFPIVEMVRVFAFTRLT